MSLKSKIKGNKITIGSWITIGDLSVAEIMTNMGFDWLTVDMEHSAITLDRAQELIQIIGLSGVTPLVRVSENDPNLIKRVMDAGAHGVIVPMVNCANDAVKAVKAVKYPPVGTRGVGLARAQGYGLQFEKYKKWVNKESVIIVQIEHIDAVEDLDNILEVEGVDGFIVGPYDLSASMGMPGEFDDPKVAAILKRVIKTAKNHKPMAGFHVVYPDEPEVLRKIKEGYKFIGFSLDSLFLGVNCGKSVGRLKAAVKR